MRFLTGRATIGLTAGLLLVAGLATAQTQNGFVRSGGRAIPGATVTAICGADRIATVTDDAGRFEMGGLPATSCRFSVGMFGFEPAQKDAAASPVSLDFELQLQAPATLTARLLRQRRTRL